MHASILVVVFSAQSFTVLIALDEMRSGKDPSGAIQLIPGSHHIGVLKDGMKPRRLWQRNWKEFFKVFFLSCGKCISLFVNNILVSILLGSELLWIFLDDIFRSS